MSGYILSHGTDGTTGGDGNGGVEEAVGDQDCDSYGSSGGGGGGGGCAGVPGQGGLSGGGSFAIFLYNSSALIEGCVIQTAGGGTGGDGGTGGLDGTGGMGGPGGAYGGSPRTG